MKEGRSYAVISSGRVILRAFEGIFTIKGGSRVYLAIDKSTPAHAVAGNQRRLGLLPYAWEEIQGNGVE